MYSQSNDTHEPLQIHDIVCIDREYHYIMRYSLASIVKRSPSFIVLDIGITVSFSHQISDDITMSIPVVKTVNDFHVSITRCSHAIMN